MLHETKANDQAQRNRSPPSDRKSPWQVERNVLQKFLGISCRTQNSVHVGFIHQGKVQGRAPATARVEGCETVLVVPVSRVRGGRTRIGNSVEIAMTPAIT